jgi:hydroxymethylglutaryl-CoA lyase
MAKKLSIIEVSPRDGLQSESIFISSEKKIEYIRLLSAAGLSEIEITSFVSPRWVPQMADHEIVTAALQKDQNNGYSVVVPNQCGYENAQRLGVKRMAFLTAASDVFCEKNLGCSYLESIRRVTNLLSHSQQESLWRRVYISCVFDCPYEGLIEQDRVLQVVNLMIQAGADEVCLGDTIGSGTPERTQRMLESIKSRVPLEKVAVHFHDTHARALDNIRVALEMGIRRVDASLSGLGGCPYAPGASGNVATESVMLLAEQFGLSTGIDRHLLTKAKQFLGAMLNQKN